MEYQIILLNFGLLSLIVVPYLSKSEDYDDYLDANSVPWHAPVFDQLNSSVLASLLSLNISIKIDPERDQKINLPGFGFNHIQADTFTNYSDPVSTIILSSNSLSTLPAKVFQPFYSTLKNLDLRRNRFHSLRNNSFLRHLKHLYCLDLSQNQLEEIFPDDFLGLHHLDTLLLRQNHLTSISNASFIHCSTIRTLDLSQNRLSFIDSGAFHQLVRLQVLLLNENPLSQRSLIVPLMQPLINLQHLDLESCSLTSLPPFLFIFNQKLESIKLRRNSFRRSDSLKRTFCGIGSLIEVDLVSTHLQSLDTCTYHQSRSISRLYLMDNPLDCSCDLLYLKYGDIYRIVSTGMYQLDQDRRPKTIDWRLDRWLSQPELQGQIEKAFRQGEIRRRPIDLSALARCATPKVWSNYQLTNITGSFAQCRERWDQFDDECDHYCHIGQKSNIALTFSVQLFTRIALSLIFLVVFSA